MATRKIKHIAQQRNCEKANTLRRKEKEKKTHSTKNLEKLNIWHNKEIVKNQTPCAEKKKRKNTLHKKREK